MKLLATILLPILLSFSLMAQVAHDVCDGAFQIKYNVQSGVFPFSQDFSVLNIEDEYPCPDNCTGSGIDCPIVFKDFWIEAIAPNGTYQGIFFEYEVDQGDPYLPLFVVIYESCGAIYYVCDLFNNSYESLFHLNLPMTMDPLFIRIAPEDPNETRTINYNLFYDSILALDDVDFNLEAGQHSNEIAIELHKKEGLNKLIIETKSPFKNEFVSLKTFNKIDFENKTYLNWSDQNMMHSVYRKKTINNQNQIQLSDIKIIENGNDLLKIFHNNIVNNEIIFSSNKKSNGAFLVHIFNAEGIPVLKNKMEYLDQNSLNISVIPAGSYFIRITNANGFSQIKKFIKV